MRERERERGSKLTDGLKNRRSTNCGYNISICESVMLSQLAETYAHDMSTAAHRVVGTAKFKFHLGGQTYID